ncbi:MAG: SDR family oxidoreductase, partial [Phycisphaerae bacterium]
MATEPLRIRERLAGHHILLTGSTGFLARAFLEKLLRAVDTVAGIHLLVRSRSGGASAEQRVLREVAGSRAFDRLRASLGDRFTRRWEEFVHVVEGDLTKERLGLERDAYAALTRRITLVVNSAATVTFDERIDLAVELNTLGPRRLLAFASDCGNVPFMHVSTCYVCGSRTGTVVEDFSPPDRGRESLPRVAPGGGYDLDALVESMRMEAGQLRHRFGADTDMCRKELIEAGMRRARAFGWNDTYTFTKWLGEQLLARDRGDVPLVIFRPAIIEGSFSEPIPGWIDGLRMADPIIVAYGKGKLCEFPGRDDIPIDLIPVDFVANAMIATLPVGAGWNRDLRVYHCASSDRNPLRLGAVRGLLQEAFLKRPMNDDDGRPVHPKPFRLVPEDVFMRRWQGKRQRVRRWQNFLKALGITGRRFRRAAALARRVDQLIYFAKIYLPYTHLDIRFSDVALREAATRLPPEDRAAFPFDVADIDWHDYVVNRHVPGLRSFVLGTGGEPTAGVLAADREAAGDPAAAGETLRGDNLFDVFRRSAERFGAHPAMQIRRNARWVRYTYEEALHATGAVMQRLVERGLSPGNRLAICGENGPEWGLTYLATMRAGLTAVPLDPQLPPQEAWAAARFAEAKLMCASGKALRDLREAREPGDPPLVAME